MKKVILPFVILTSLLASCGQQEVNTNSTSASEAAIFLKDNNIIPSPTRHIYLIDSTDKTVSEIKAKSPSSSIGSLSLDANSLEIEIVKDAIFTEEKSSQNSLSLQAVACTSTSQERSLEPYYKNSILGSKGFNFDVKLPTDSEVTNTTQAKGHIYGGYATSSANVENGFQYNGGNIWQPYFRVANLTPSEYGPNTSGVWKNSWMIPSIYFPGGDTINLTSSTYIGSDGKHYIVANYLYRNTYYTFGYRDDAAWITSLKPSNISNITVRKVIGLAYQGSVALPKGAKITNASITNSLYLNAQDTYSTWNRNSCYNNTTNYTVSITGTAPLTQDLVSVTSNP